MVVDHGLEAPPDLAAGLSAFWARIAAPRHALLAVSGGSDSVALMRLAARLAAGGVAQFHVATVDHGLRPGSFAEAQSVGAMAAALGFKHAILPWRGSKPQTGLQAAARAARYRLLIEEAHRVGAGAIVVAHSADDQAETVYMRRARGSGPRGLAGMAEQSLIAADTSAPILLLRPLLAIRREELRAFLQSIDAPYIDDPSNSDRRFERVRVRTELAQSQMTVGALLRLSADMSIEAGRIEANENARFAALGGRFDAYGAAHFSTSASPDGGLIARLLAAVGGGDFPPTSEAAASAFEKARSGAPATLSGALIEGETSGFSIRREAAALFGRAGIAAKPPAVLAPGARMLFDARFIVENRRDEPAILRAITADEAAQLGLGTCAIGAPALFVSDKKGARAAAIPGEAEGFFPLAAEKFYQRVNRFH